MVEESYDPLDKKRLAESVAKALLERTVGPLPPTQPFDGAGIYAIYYTGPFQAYEPLAQRNRQGRFEVPIYVGKAIPPGRRKGGAGFEPTTEPVLYHRLREHAETIQQAENLKLNDFACRYLVVDHVWIPMAETMLIERFSPLWNVVIDGFGIHDPGSGRYKQQRSRWDVLHPGRKWAIRMPPNRQSREEILQAVEDFFRSGR